MKSKKLEKEDKKKNKTDPTDSRETRDESEEIGEDSGDVLRSLTVIYGFFFVFMSVIVAGAQILSVTLADTASALIFFVIVFGLAIACSMIGLEIFMILNEMGMTFVGDWGIRILISFVPMIFTFITGYTVLADKEIYGISFPPFMFWLVGWFQLLIVVLLYFKMRKEYEETEEPKEVEKQKD